MATINLGSIKFKWQGAYNGATAYTVDDVVSYNGSSYICILASTGNLPTNATYWEQMSSAGTNGTDGTDLGTTLTTQGDIVYRDASGLARLPAGSANQVLQSGGAGANPSWGTISSDYVQLAETNITSAVGSVTLDGYFSSTYDTYKIIGYIAPTGADSLALRFRIGNAQASANNYAHILNKVYYRSGVASGVTTAGEVWPGNDNYVKIIPGTLQANTSSHPGYFELTFINPLDTSNHKHMGIVSYLYTDPGYMEHYNGFTYYNANTTALSGITIFPTGGGNFGEGTIKMYGIK